MKILLYAEGLKTIGKSGLGKAIQHQMKALEDEFTINYIQKKNTMTYDQFVEKWLATGGSQEEKSATQQLNELGYVK